ncbi:hydrolase [Halorubellus salinus]|uniref:hydrolase n=1 Tax=Halorubellus salinus TaxID=755309 RepID=UPI001D06353E|nr:hydrolase [Halorubellus salinus]
MGGQWHAGAVEDDAGAGPPSVASWEPVTVPGRPTRFAGADAVAYRKRFPDPRRAASQRVVLDCRGLYGDATVYLNGDVVGTHDTYFAPARFEFEPGEENELVVVCRRPTDGYAGAYASDVVPDELSVPGIWWGVHLRLRPRAYLADLAVNARRPDDDRGVVDVAVTVDAGERVDDTVTVSVRPENFRGSGGSMERVPVEADAGERVTVTHSVDVRDPASWWPADRGDPNRYTVRARFADHERTVSTGFRTVAYDRDDGLRVNGERVRARGVNVLPTTEPEADLERARDLNATLVRVHGHVLPSSFYDAADDAGVFVAQDLPLSGPDPDGGRSVERGRTLARRLAAHVDHHPSVACYGVHGDPVEPFTERVGTGRTSRYRIRTRAARTTVDRELADAVASALPPDAVTFPVCGPLGAQPDAAHLYPGWRYGRAADVDWLTDTYPEAARVVTEFGAGSLTAAGGGTVAPVDLDKDVHDAVLSDADAGTWGDRTAGDGGASDDAASDGGGVVAGNDVVARSQGTQARILSRVASGFRRHGSDVLAAFCLRDVDAGGGMGVYAVDGSEKPAASALGDALAPVQAFLAADPPGAVPVALVNDAPAAVSGTVTVTTDDVDAAFQVEAPALGTATAGTVSIPATADVVDLAFETSAGEVTRRVYL